MNAPIPNITAPIAVVLVDPVSGSMYRLAGAYATSPLATVPNSTAPIAVAVFNTATQSLVRAA